MRIYPVHEAPHAYIQPPIPGVSQPRHPVMTCRTQASMKGKQFERNDRVMFASYDKYTEADVPAGEKPAEF